MITDIWGKLYNITFVSPKKRYFYVQERHFSRPSIFFLARIKVCCLLFERKWLGGEGAMGKKQEKKVFGRRFSAHITRRGGERRTGTKFETLRDFLHLPPSLLPCLFYRGDIRGRRESTCENFFPSPSFSPQLCRQVGQVGEMLELM